MRRHIPSLGALRAFETAARHLSFTRAADELNLTQSAISRQIRTLEELLGFELFHRIRQRLILTRAGATYLPEIRMCLQRIETATVDLIAHQGRENALTIGILPTFGTKWLVPRLPHFYRANPDLMINFATRSSPFDFGTENIDAAIHFGDDIWPGTDADRLMGEDVVAVCSPAFAAVASLESPADLARCTLLQHSTRPYAWRDWLEGAGAGEINGFSGPRFEQIDLMIRAAVAGLGVAAVPLFLISEELETGRLIIPFPVHVPNPQAYWLVYPPAKRDMAPLKAFREWLLCQVSGECVPA